MKFRVGVQLSGRSFIMNYLSGKTQTSRILLAQTKIPQCSQGDLNYSDILVRAKESSFESLKLKKFSTVSLLNKGNRKCKPNQLFCMNFF
jgi:hypothetical protein